MRNNITAAFAVALIIYVVSYIMLKVAIKSYIWNPLKNDDGNDSKIKWRHPITQIQESKFRKRLLADLTKEIADRERQIANNIHDVFLSDLAALRMMLWSFNGTHTEKQNIRNVVEEVIKKARNIVDSLRPETLDTLGLEKTLDILFNSLPIIINRRFTGNLSIVPSGIDLQVYLIVKECLTNVIKHASVGSAEVNFKVNQGKKNDKIIFEIKDKGAGFDVNNYTKGVGLESIKSRALSFGALELVSNIGIGTCVKVFIKLRK